MIMIGGWLSLKGYSDKYYTEPRYINVYVSFFVNNNYVSITAYPNQYLTVYKMAKQLDLFM